MIVANSIAIRLTPDSGGAPFEGQFVLMGASCWWTVGTFANFDGEQFQEHGVVYPAETPTWNSAAVVLAADALGGGGPAAGLFRGEGLPVGLTPEELIEAGAAIESELAAGRVDRS